MMPAFRPAVVRLDVRLLSDAERAHAEIQTRWERDEGGYHHILETRPQTLVYGLHASPAGLVCPSSKRRPIRSPTPRVS
jgi:hypothetical protein